MTRGRVVLVRPHFAGNIGAVARVMHNFGWSHLVLVDPIASPTDPEARRLATHGEFILDRATMSVDLCAAIADCTCVAATSAKIDGVVRGTLAGSIRELMPTLLRSAGQGEIALVFGPEPSGLTTAEIALCHYLLHIPTNPEYSSLNLAQATAICLYECHVQRLPPIAVADIADHAAQARMFEHLEEGLRSIHYLYGEKADSLMAGIRHLLGRAMPTETELRMLHGLSRQLRWIADQANSPEAD